MPTCMIAMRSVSTAVDVALVAHIAIAVLQSAAECGWNSIEFRQGEKCDSGGRTVSGVSGKL